MDKFGIFKLLNSFFNFYNQSSATKQQQESASNPSLTDFISSFLNNNASNVKNQPAPNQLVKNQPAQKAPPPLQSSMLGVMNSHDQFIKRVKEKQKQN